MHQIGSKCCALTAFRFLASTFTTTGTQGYSGLNKDFKFVLLTYVPTPTGCSQQARAANTEQSPHASLVCRPLRPHIGINTELLHDPCHLCGGSRIELGSITMHLHHGFSVTCPYVPCWRTSQPVLHTRTWTLRMDLDAQPAHRPPPGDTYPSAYFRHPPIS